jgi:hypothetical protein
MKYVLKLDKIKEGYYMNKIILALILLSLELFSAQKASLGLNINTDDLEIEGRSTLGYDTRNPVLRNFFVDANFINADDTLVGIGLFVENSPTNFQNVSFIIGLRSIFTDHDGSDFTALPILLGAKARMYLGDFPKSNFGIKFAYAPTPLTFQDADAYFEYRLEFDMMIINNVNVYVGYRNIDTNYESHDFNYNDSMYVGFKFVLD